MEKQIADTVMKMAKDNACILEEQSEVPPSLTEGEIKSYLNEVIAEVAKSTTLLAKTKSKGICLRDSNNSSSNLCNGISISKPVAVSELDFDSVHEKE